MKIRKISNITNLKTMYDGEYTNIYNANMEELVNIIDVNKTFLLNNSYTIDFDGTHESYMFNPKYLSKTIYGSPDLWFVLLLINNIDEDADFNTNLPIVALDYNSINFINRILNTL